MECKPLFSKEQESYTLSNKSYSDWIRHSITQSNSLFTTNMGLTLHFTLNHFSLLFAFNQLERAKLASVCKYAKRSLRLARLCQVVSVCYCTSEVSEFSVYISPVAHPAGQTPSVLSPPECLPLNYALRLLIHAPQHTHTLLRSNQSKASSPSPHTGQMLSTPSLMFSHTGR